MVASYNTVSTNVPKTIQISHNFTEAYQATGKNHGPIKHTEPIWLNSIVQDEQTAGTKIEHEAERKYTHLAKTNFSLLITWSSQAQLFSQLSQMEHWKYEILIKLIQDVQYIIT